MKVLDRGYGLAGEAIGVVAKVRGNTIPTGEKVKSHRHPNWHVTVVLKGTIVFSGEGETLKVDAPGFVEVKAGEEHELRAFGGDAEYCCIGPKDF